MNEINFNFTFKWILIFEKIWGILFLCNKIVLYIIIHFTIIYYHGNVQWEIKQYYFFLISEINLFFILYKIIN